MILFPGGENLQYSCLSHQLRVGQMERLAKAPRTTVTVMVVTVTAVTRLDLRADGANGRCIRMRGETLDTLSSQRDPR